MTLKPKDIRESREKFLDGLGVPAPSTFSPDDFQLKAIESVALGHDTLVIAPTGAGKTFIATEGIKQAVGQGKRAIYTAPLKALSNTKYAELKKLFEPEHSVGLLTGDRKIEANANVVVATTEIYRNDLYNYGESYSLVVLDELHYLADPQRGPVWEESIILSPESATLLMLSASISNSTEIATWIEEVRGRPVTVIIATERPVPLRYGFLHDELGIIPLADEKGEVFEPVSSFYADGGSQPRSRSFRGPRGSGRGGNSRGRRSGGNRSNSNRSRGDHRNKK